MKKYLSICVLIWLLSPQSAFSYGKFQLGSYGRVGISSDENGARGGASQITPFGPRLIETSYLELDFQVSEAVSKLGNVSILSTLAFGDALFHDNGQWQAQMALRRFQLAIRGIYGTRWYAIVGSQWNRGDDIYLMNFWPLDDLNSNGGTVGFDGERWQLMIHSGVNRLADPSQNLRRPVAAPFFGAVDAQIVDRQRFVNALSLTRKFGKRQKVKLYSEFHYLPGRFVPIEERPEVSEFLSDDLGYMFGAQYGIWGFGDQGHLNVFVRAAKGLAAYDELEIARAVNADRRSVDARELRLALSANFETEYLSLMTGGYVRSFVDGDVNEQDFDDRNEGALSVRPMLRLGHFTPAVEASVQMSRPNGVDPRTNEQSIARVVQVGFIPAWSLTSDKPSAYSRPQLRAIAACSFLNEAALSRFAEADPRSQRPRVWYFGLGAEWWFGRGGGY